MAELTAEERTDMVQHWLAHATRDELLKEFASRNLCTVILFEGQITQPDGKMGISTLSAIFGTLTHVHGMIQLHVPGVMANICQKIAEGYQAVNQEDLKGN